MDKIHALPLDHFYTEPGRDRFILVLSWARMLHADAVWVRADEHVCAYVPARPDVTVAAEALAVATEQGRNASPEA
jgi:hypothetical protein